MGEANQRNCECEQLEPLGESQQHYTEKVRGAIGGGAPEAAAEEAQSLRQGWEAAAEAQRLAWADEAAMTRGASLLFWTILGSRGVRESGRSRGVGESASRRRGG